MPIVNGKHYPYTKAGVKAANKARMKKEMRKEMMTADGFMKVKK